MKNLALVLLAALLMLACACASAEILPGGWAPSENPEITEERQELFDKGMDLVGVQYVPVAYLGSQIVAGTNHCFLCQATVVYPGAIPYYTLVYLHEALDGEVTILNIATLDIGALCTYGALDTVE